LIVLAGLASATFALSVDAQQLWKYTDKNGKVTYSDKPPRKDEKAEPIKHDPKENVIESSKNRATARPETLSREEGGGSPGQRTQASAVNRELLQQAVDRAREELDNARSALEDGRTPLQDELVIIVGRNAKGAPTGVNNVQRKPEYFARVAQLEDAVKQAEKRLEEAEIALGKAK
jgi:hypothetical protein